MNRQTVVDAVNAAGDLGSTGHAITYDLNGNRLSDSYWGNKVTATQTQIGRTVTGYVATPVYNEYSTNTPRKCIVWFKNSIPSQTIAKQEHVRLVTFPGDADDSRFEHQKAAEWAKHCSH